MKTQRQTTAVGKANLHTARRTEEVITVFLNKSPFLTLCKLCMTFVLHAAQ